MMTPTSAAIISGAGFYVPPTVVTNDMLSAILDTSDDWIQSRTGIRERRVVDGDTATSDLAVEAGRRALQSASTWDVDAVIVATTTPDHPCPATAPAVAARLGLGQPLAFDISAVCTGFLYALTAAAGLVSTGVAETALVIGAEAFTTILDPRDRTTRPIFGDGAGAMVIRRGEPGEPGALLATHLASDGTQDDLIMVPAGGSRYPFRADDEHVEPRSPYFTMKGRAVFENAVLRMVESTDTVLDKVGWSTDELDWLIGHQANKRILNAVAQKLGLDTTRCVINLDRYGNTAGASLPIAFAEALSSNVLRPGDRIAMTAFGGGTTWGTVAFECPQLAVAA